MRSLGWGAIILALVSSGCGSVGASKADGGMGVGGGGGAGTGGAAGGGDGAAAGPGGGGGVVVVVLDAAVTDAPAPAGCSVLRPFSTPVLVGGVNGQSGNDQGARLSPDELSVYFHSNRGGGNLDLYAATRPSRTAAFANVTALSTVNDPSTDAWPTVTADGLSLFFETQRPAPQVWVATRSTLVGTFSSPTAVANIGSMGAQPFVLPDGSALYFSSPGDLYRAGRGASGQFEAPVAIPTINTPSSEYTPALTPDELTLYFASDRTDSPAKGDFDIWMSTRASRGVAFGAPVNVQELNTASGEAPNWISPDNCRLYFDRLGSTGEKIFVAERL